MKGEVKLEANFVSNQTVWSVDWHPVLNLLAVVGSNKKVELYQRIEQTQLVKTFTWKLSQTLDTQHTKTIRCVRFGYSGKYLAVGSFDTKISVFVLVQGLFEHMTVLEGHDYQVKCLAWVKTSNKKMQSKDIDRKFASCSRDKNIWIWEFDPISYDYSCASILQGHTQDIKFIEWIDQNTLVSASYDNTLKIWCQDDDDFIQLQTLEGHKSIVWALDVDSQITQEHRQRIFSVGEDRSVICWQRMKQSFKYELVYRIQNVHIESIYTCALWRDSSIKKSISENEEKQSEITYSACYLVCGAGDNQISIIDTQKKKILQKRYFGTDINCVRVSRSTNLLAVCGENGNIFILSKQQPEKM